MEFQDGYQTVLGERGVTVSGGQKQRISIARALLKDAPILILDDSLSAVDTDTEEQILTNLKQRRAGATTLIIAHRISTIQHADHVLVLEDGQRAEYGTHEELMALGGLYRAIYDKQQLEKQLREEHPAEGRREGRWLMTAQKDDQRRPEAAHALFRPQDEETAGHPLRGQRHDPAPGLHEAPPEDLLPSAWRWCWPLTALELAGPSSSATPSTSTSPGPATVLQPPAEQWEAGEMADARFAGRAAAGGLYLLALIGLLLCNRAQT